MLIGFAASFALRYIVSFSTLSYPIFMKVLYPETAKEILRSGSNLIVETANFYPDTLKSMAAIAKASGAHITVRQGTLYPDTMKEIAEIGGGHITFII
jgi:hypothetical protein